MGLLDRAVSQGTAQYVIYACLAAPAFAFGLRMYNARNEYNRSNPYQSQYAKADSTPQTRRK
ncbi:predicted protein [Micromonas commoda]|uniref:Uncharacterized protein n=1 Tax=Micromonas commoda (strain RCC299 / NOUM17 / CCMP2709) TaxID=296587 RepID=C1E035_MICCC|nr:predicted protein [Micromonas commoda]ACO60749.1 predicted protein [Micromonas commoda]|eukprot:XP_002499491.1 predicted protein [Micromonas commoda]